MSPKVDTGDLIDAQAVAELLGLAQRTSVNVYQRRYPDMPRPVADPTPGPTPPLAVLGDRGVGRGPRLAMRI